jgi:DNA-nicking Smr family endonuclease
MHDNQDDAVEYPIDGILDLHHFAPKDVKDLVPEYIEACLERGITEIRIIHGKGIGNLRRTVHALLERNEHVISFRLDSQSASSWGATLVTLRPKQ